MKYRCITGGPISENCYLLVDEKMNQAAVVDPGFLNDVLLNEIKKYTVQRILLTHGHFDHIWEADRLHEMLGVPVCAYETEAAFAADDKQNGSLLMMYESITCKVHEAFKDGNISDRRSAGHGAAHARPHRGRRELHYAGRRVYGRYADGLLRRAVRPANRQQCRAA